MKFPWQKRRDQAQAETDKAKTDYEWAVQNRTTVSAIVGRLTYHGERNEIVERLNTVIRGGRKDAH